MKLTHDKTGEFSMLYTDAYFERGNTLDIDGVIYYIVSRHTFFLSWKYVVRKANWLEVLGAKWNSFWKRVLG